MDCKCPELPVYSHIFVFILLKGCLNIYGLKRQNIDKPVLHFYGCFALHVSAMNRFYWCVNGHLLFAVICVTTVLKYRMSCLFLQLIFVSMHLYLFITRENIWVIVYFQCSSICFLFQNLKDSLIAYIFPFEILCCLPVVPILLNMTKAPVKSYFIYWML